MFQRQGDVPMRRRRFTIPMSIVVFLAATLVGTYVVRKRVLEYGLRAVFESRDEGLIREWVDSWPSPVRTEIEKDYTVLEWAVWAGKTDLVKRCLEKGAEINVRRAPIGGCPWRATPLYFAVYRGRRDIVEVLIAHGADVNIPFGAKGREGRTPLQVAASDGESDVVRLLIAAGADVDAKGGSGQTPLHVAAEYGTKSAAEVLIEAGADVNAKDTSGQTPLAVAHQPPESGGTSESPGRDEVAKLLAEHGAKE